MDLTPDQRAEADRVYQALRAATDADLRGLAELLAGKPDGAIFGRTEFEVRDRVHRIGAKAVELTLAGRKKRGTSGAAAAVRGAAGPARSGGSAVERAAERAGADVGRRLAAGETFGPARDWAWQPDADGRTCAYVSGDSTGVGMQGEHGAAADGRMAAVGMVYNPGVAGQARYLAGLTGGLAGLGEPLRRRGARGGMGRAERWRAIRDGGAGVGGLAGAGPPR